VDSSEALRRIENLNGLLLVDTEGKAGKSFSEKVGDIRENWAPMEEVGLRLLPRSLSPKQELVVKSDGNE